MQFSEFIEMREDFWNDPANIEIFERYKELYALTDFFIMFHATPHMQEHYGGKLESLGRSVGLDWVFDHAKTPPQFVQYLDLLIDGEGVFLTMIPEGAFSFHPDIANGSWGLVHNTWEEVLDVIINDYKSSTMEGGLPSLHYKRLIKLLRAMAENDTV
ncbi:MAG: hypothetical protein WC647_03960 [Desulfomonilaceae bacterium]